MESPKGITRIAGPGSTIIAIPIAKTAMPITATINRFPCLTIFSIGPAAYYLSTTGTSAIFLPLEVPISIINLLIKISPLHDFNSQYSFLIIAHHCYAGIDECIHETNQFMPLK